MTDHPAPRRKGEVEARRFAEEERLFDRGLTRPSVNALLVRMQEHLGSKNKLGLAVYGRKNAAGAVKQVMEGATRYTDDVLDRIIRVADELGIPRVPKDTLPVPEIGEAAQDDHCRAERDADTTAAQYANDVLDRIVTATDDAGRAETPGEECVSPQPDGDQPGEHSAANAPPQGEAAAGPCPSESSPAPADSPEHVPPLDADWLQGVRTRRIHAVSAIDAGERRLQELNAEIDRLRSMILRVEEEQDASRNIVKGIDAALSILESI